jgi:hypothetical protein
MVTWHDFASVAPELSAFGEQRLHGRVAYLATVRADGGPRVHPVTPIIGQGHLFVFMEPTSPKGHDLRRHGRYALHCSVEDSGGGRGEFFVDGPARLVEDASLRQGAAEASPYSPAERYILFELGVARALSTHYDEDNQPVRQRWQAD